MSKKSLVWEYFQRDDDKVKCLLCKKIISNKGNTTNLHSHLKNVHPIKYGNLQKTKLLTVETSDAEAESSSSLIEVVDISPNAEDNLEIVEIRSGRSPTPTQSPSPSTSSFHMKTKTTQPTIEAYSLNTKHSAKIDRALAYFIAVGMQPYSIIDNEGFKHLLKVVQPSYKVPSRKTLSEGRIPQLYLETKDALRSCLMKAEFIAFTTDAWTSNSNTPFLSLTAHFIINWQLQSVCLNCKEMSEDHSGENIKSVLNDLLKEWEISINKVSAFTTDSGSNMIKCCELMKICRISCFGHTINTAITRAFELEDLEDVIKKVKNIQNVFAHSWHISRELKKYQEQYTKTTKVIPSFSKTRWWSLLHLIERITEQHLALTALFQEYAKGKYKHLILEISELDVLKNIVNILKPIQAVTEIMSGEKYVTASAILPIYNKIKTELRSVDTDETQLDEIHNVTKIHFVQSIINYLEDRYNKPITATYLSICTFLDPRFKDDVTILQNIKNDILFEMELITRSHYEPPAKKPNSGLGIIFGASNELEDDETDESEFNRYVSTFRVDFSEDPLIWWSTNYKIFPKLSKLAKKYLCSQATSVSSERVFSKGGRIITDARASLTTEHSEQLIFLAMNKNHVRK